LKEEFEKPKKYCLFQLECGTKNQVLVLSISKQVLYKDNVVKKEVSKKTKKINFVFSKMIFNKDNSDTLNL
jgi:hypothetical protein